MKYPIFKRRRMTFEMWNYYEQKTDVCVYGTPASYRHFARLLQSGEGSVQIPADKRGGMDVLVLPPAKEPLQDFMVIQERLVHQAGRFNMELMLGGSAKGLSMVADYFERASSQLAPDPDDHLHLDENAETLLVLPAVSLNIRGPMEDLEDRLADLAPAAPEDLPPDFVDDPQLWPYYPIAYQDMYGRLPIREKA